MGGAAVVSDWLVFGGSVRGPDHEREHLPCQDAWARGPAGHHGVALCLCDGAGSASHAEVGARVVSAAVVEALRDLHAAGPTALSEALRAACVAGRQALVRAAAEVAVSPAALACTLVAVVSTGDLVAVAHRGDGAVVGQRAGSGELVVLSGPDRGEYVNETWFVTSASWEARLRVAVHTEIDALCVVTDGCQDACLVHGGAPAPFAPFFAPIFAFAAEVDDASVASSEVTELLDGAGLRGSSGDDKTLAVARRRARS